MTVEIKNMEPGGGSAEVNEPASRAASLDAAVQAVLGPVRDWMCGIERRIDGSQSEAAARTPSDLGEIAAGMAELREAIQSLRRDLARELAELRQEMKSRVDRPADVAHSLAAAAQTDPAAEQERWEQALLGRELVQNPDLALVRRQLLDDILAGQDAARSLAGQMMLFQSAAVDKIADLMRHVGEAYYQWRPRTTAAEEALERALASWVVKRAAATGLRNTIELVCPGDRFDSSRHLASERGAEIVAVHGWVVLRENGKVFTKANVTVK